MHWYQIKIWQSQNIIDTKVRLIRKEGQYIDIYVILTKKSWNKSLDKQGRGQECWENLNQWDLFIYLYGQPWESMLVRKMPNIEQKERLLLNNFIISFVVRTNFNWKYLSTHLPSFQPPLAGLWYLWSLLLTLFSHHCFL